MSLKKKNRLSGLLETIEGVSDKDYQLRVWIRGEGPEVDDFDETANYLLGDGEYILKHPKEFELTDQQYALLKEFFDKFHEFAFSNEIEYPPNNFLNNPEWIRIMEMAKGILKAFGYE